MNAVPLMIVFWNFHIVLSATNKDAVLVKESTCSALISKGNAVDSFEYFVEKYGSNDTLTVAQLFNFIKMLDPESVTLPPSVLKNINCQIQINSTVFSTICPMLVKYLDLYNIKHNSMSESSHEVINKPLSRGAIWGYGVLSVTIISICSLVGISVLPLMKSAFYNKILLYLVTLAVGTLSSNALFQLIPEGFGIDGNPETVWRSAVIFGGFYIFYLMENILERIFNTSHSHEANNCDGSVNSPEYLSANRKDQVHGDDLQKKCDIIITDYSQETLLTTSENMSKVSSDESVQRSVDVISHKPKSKCHKRWQWIFKNYKTIKTVAWMITIADGIHNLIDGLAIGASFSSSMVQGISTSLAIFCEEFPHELGDFAILLSSGMSVRQAAFYNFASACCCYVGLAIGIVLGHNFSAAQWIFALAGGVFLYISLAGMLPEAQAQCASKELRKSPWLCLILKHAGLLSGFIIMFVLTLYKDKITVLV